VLRIGPAPAFFCKNLGRFLGPTAHCLLSSIRDQFRKRANHATLLLAVLVRIFSGNSPDNIFGHYTEGGGNTFC
jgi:hypothetical protein